MRLVRLAVESYNPLNPDLAETNVVGNSPISGVVLPFSHTALAMFRRETDEHILADPSRRQNLRFIIVSGKLATFLPKADDVLITTEGANRIIGINSLAPDGSTPIIHYVGAVLDVHKDLSGLTDDDILVTDEGAALQVQD